MRPLLLALVAAAALAAAPTSALAKGVIAAQVCGAGGCADAPRDTFGALLAEGDQTNPPQAAAPFVEIRLTVMGGPHGQTDRFAFDYLQSLGLTRPHDAGGGWVKLRHQSRASLNEAIGATALRSASELARIAGLPDPTPRDGGGGLPWWAIAGAALALLALLARFGGPTVRTRPASARPAPGAPPARSE